MATIVKLDGVRPTIGDGVWLAPTAVLVGDVHVGDRASIWFGAALERTAAAEHQTYCHRYLTTSVVIEGS